jgi:hypothetical protein
MDERYDNIIKIFQWPNILDKPTLGILCPAE